MGPAGNPSRQAAGIDEFRNRTGLHWVTPSGADFGAGFEAQGDDLALQGYVGTYGEQLKKEVPRRLFTADLGNEVTVAHSTKGESADWVAQKATVDLWSLGVGMVTVVYRIEAKTSEWVALLSEIDNRRRILREAQVSIASKWDGQPLWMYVVLLIEAPNATGYDDLDKIARELSYEGLRAELLPPHPGAVVRVYFNTCAAFIRDERIVGIKAARMAAAHSAIWATAANFEWVLLKWFSQQSSSLRDLEKRSRELLNLYRDMQHFRTVVGALPLQLDMLEMPLWNAISKQWGLEAELNSVGARFDALDHLTGHLLQDATERSATRLNLFVFIFTVASLVTFGSTVIEFVRSQPAGIHTEDLLLLLGLGFGTAIVGAIAWMGIHDPRRPRSDGRRPTQDR